MINDKIHVSDSVEFKLIKAEDKEGKEDNKEKEEYKDQKER
jgi:hypothetical protein